MRIEELHLKNFRCFKELDIQFPKSNLAVFIGLNGAGKSAILDAISSMLFLWTKKGVIYNPKRYTLFSDKDINMSFSELTSNICVNFDNHNISWKASKKINESSKTEINESYEANLAVTNAQNFTILKYTVNRYKSFVKYEVILKEIGDFGDFKTWFVEEVNRENRAIIETKNFSITNPKLDIIRKAIEVFCSNISNMRVSNLRTKDIKNNTDVVVDWDGLELSISQLSEGQKNLLLLASDIAFSLMSESEVINSPLSDTPDSVLQRKGIVLIDEIELHLHPQWQREVLPALQKTFPNIQFIVTTHSPQVLSRVHKDDIFILKDNQLYQPSSNPIGRDSSDILDEIMDITKRPDDIQKLSDDYFLLLAKNELEEAAKIRTKLDKLVEDKKLDKDDPIFYRANGILARKQLLKK